MAQEPNTVPNETAKLPDEVLSEVNGGLTQEQIRMMRGDQLAECPYIKICTLGHADPCPFRGNVICKFDIIMNKPNIRGVKGAR